MNFKLSPRMFFFVVIGALLLLGAPRITNFLLLTAFGRFGGIPEAYHEEFYIYAAFRANQPELCEKINKFSYEKSVKGGDGFMGPIFLMPGDTEIFLRKSECYYKTAWYNKRPDLCDKVKSVPTVFSTSDRYSKESCLKDAKEGFFNITTLFPAMMNPIQFKGSPFFYEGLGYKPKDPAMARTALKKFYYLLVRDVRLQQSDISKRIDTVLNSKKYYSKDEPILDSDWEIFAYMKAINSNDNSLCSKIREGVFYPEFIEKVPVRDMCFYHVARNTRDQSSCAKISDRTTAFYGQILKNVCVKEIDEDRSQSGGKIFSGYSFPIRTNEYTAKFFDILGYSDKIFDYLSLDDLVDVHEDFIDEIPAGTPEGQELLRRIKNMPSY